MEITFRKIPISDQLEKLWQSDKTEMLKFYASKQSDKLTHKELEHLFIDMNGAQYYKFPKMLDLPLMRKGELTGYYTFMASGISGQEQDHIITTMKQALFEGLAKPEIVAKVSALVHVMVERRRMCFHSELMLNIAAIQAVREDEDPVVFNKEIHMEKIVQFKKEISNSNAYFFFVKLQLPVPIDLSRTSQAEFTTLWHESEVAQAALPEILNLIAQAKESLSTKKSSKSS